MDATQHIDEIIADVFRKTGCKLDRDDPVTIAGLYNRTFIEETVAAAVRESELRLVGALDTASKQWVAKTDEQVARISNIVLDGARNSAKEELPRVKREIYALKDVVLEQIRTSTKTTTSTGTAVAMILGALLIAAASFAAGTYVNGRQLVLSKADTQDIEIGRTWHKIAPKLDQPTREKLVNLLEGQNDHPPPSPPHS